MTDVQTVYRWFNRVMSLVVGLVVLSLSGNHLLNASSSLVAQGIPLFGVIQLPGLPDVVAMLVGLFILPIGVKLVLDAVAPGYLQEAMNGSGY